MAVAIHSYAEKEGTLPPAALRGKGGRPLLSWRVAILPYIEQEALYREFRLDEPWDSPHNLALLPRMPRLYAPFDGSQPSELHSTFYQVFVSKGTPFEGPRGLKLKPFQGGRPTLLIVEAGEAVPWTKPADLVYDPARPLPKLGGILRDGRFRATLADSFVGTYDLSDEAELRSAISRTGSP
jgi:hypothetical protein